jgi:hypothetical protein
MSMYQVQSGIKIYVDDFDSSADYMFTIFWTFVAAIIGATTFGFVAIKCSNIGANEPIPDKEKFEKQKEDDDETGED